MDPGEIVDHEEILWEHIDVINYTVGQRRGLGMRFLENTICHQIRRRRKKVIVGPKALLKTTHVPIEQ